MCVSHPGQRVFHHHFSTSRGTVYPTEVTVQRRGFCGGTDISSGRGTDVPAFNTMTPLVHPAAVLCFHGPSCYHPQTGFPTAAFSRRRSAALLQMSEQIVKHFSCADLSPYVSLTFLPNVILALTENPSSKCVLLSRPTRVLSVIPFTGALFLHGKATTPTLHRSLEHHRKAPTPTLNQLPHRPPGQKTVFDKLLRFRTSDFRFRHSFFFSGLPIMCVFMCSLCCCRDSLIDSTQGRALQLFSLIRDA